MSGRMSVTAEAAQPLRQADQVRRDPGLLEAEEGAAATAPGLHVVDDQHHAVFARQALEATQPLRAGGVHAALALHRLHDERGGRLDAAVAAAEMPVEHVERVDVTTEETVERHDRRVVETGVGGGPGAQVAADRQRPEAHSVESVREGDDVAPAGGLARQLERRLDGVRAAGTGELQLVLQPARLQDHFIERLEKAALRARREVEAVRDPIPLQVLDEAALEFRVVVAVVENARAGEEVDELTSPLVDETAAARLRKHSREEAAVATDLRFQPVEGFHGGSVAPPARRYHGVLHTRCVYFCTYARLRASSGVRGVTFRRPAPSAVRAG
jgi:hypothetical protein